MNKIKKNVIYTNQDNQDFEFGINNDNDPMQSVLSDAGLSSSVSKYFTKNSREKSLFFRTTNGNDELHFLTPEEVDEFIEILKEWKEKTWPSEKSNEILENYE